MSSAAIADKRDRSATSDQLAPVNPFTDAPAGVIPPPVDPTGAKLNTQKLAEGVYALVSDRAPVDNAGFIVGERGVLVVDAHINEAMARQIQQAIADVTDKPIRYLVNTNFHADHTFGNAFFPESTTIIAHRATAQRMQFFDQELELFRGTVLADNPSVLDGVRHRGPDTVFDDYLKIDLGGQVVELYHFGFGNTPGDTVVWSPAARAAWTGNLVMGAGVIPLLLEGRVDLYLETISRFAATLQPKVIISGHGFLTDGAHLGHYLDYLAALLGTVRGLVESGKDLGATLEAYPLPAEWIPPAGSPGAPMRDFLIGVHRLNVQKTHRELTG